MLTMFSKSFLPFLFTRTQATNPNSSKFTQKDKA
ncbi:exported hypothetical protein [Lacticaseibacillus paracasei]|nr:exported hypothetical protein [Lacticaseibacillus paracasei]